EAGIVEAIAMIESVAGSNHIMAGRLRISAAEIALRRKDDALAAERAGAAIAIFEHYGDAAAAEREAAARLREKAQSGARSTH
ncbi:MAG: hypothetical protein JNL94_02655, partial [Planctomycetes bacterium]|nr:hypothetical protein [Planctomycetota bacterium]